MKVNRKTLLDALRKVRPGVDDNSTNISGMDCFIFMDGRVYAHDDAVSISTPTEVEGNFAISAVEFYNIIYRFNGEILELNFEADRVALKCGRAKAEVLFRMDDVSKRIRQIAPPESAWKVLPEDFHTAMKLLTIKNIAADLSMKIGGIYFAGTYGFASDNASVCRYVFSHGMDKMWIPPKASKLIASMADLKEYCIVDSWLHFKSDTISISCRRLIDDRYPALSFDELVSKAVKGKISGTFTKEFLEVIDRAIVFGKDKENDLVMGLTFDGKTVTVTSGGGSGSFSEEVETNLICEDPGTIYIGAMRLKQAIARWPDGVEFFVGIQGANPLLVLQKDTFSEVIGLYKE